MPHQKHLLDLFLIWTASHTTKPHSFLSVPFCLYEGSPARWTSFLCNNIRYPQLNQELFHADLGAEIFLFMVEFRVQNDFVAFIAVLLLFLVDLKFNRVHWCSNDDLILLLVRKSLFFLRLDIALQFYIWKFWWILNFFWGRLFFLN